MEADAPALPPPLTVPANIALVRVKAFEAFPVPHPAQPPPHRNVDQRRLASATYTSPVELTATPRGSPNQACSSSTLPFARSDSNSVTTRPFSFANTDRHSSHRSHRETVSISHPFLAHERAVRRTLTTQLSFEDPSAL